MNKNLIISILLINVFFFTSCNQTDDVRKVEVAQLTELPFMPPKKDHHPYGGWSCPDNLMGFPPVDLQDLDKVPVVNGRLPTKEETRNGTSLLFFDLEEYPDAKPLDMTMPRVARYYSEYTKKNEVVIVIQAVTVDNESVVGFRYLNGGNGSAWLSEVDFLSEEEVDQLGATPFVSIDLEIDASRSNIWEVITSPAYARELGEMFDKNAYVESDWRANSEVHFKYAPDQIVSTGIITALWEDLYIQVDYDFDGYHYAEKFLILDNKDTKNTQFHVVAGPYGEDFEAQKIVWNNWLHKVKELSEKNN